jgi:chromate reductase
LFSSVRESEQIDALLRLKQLIETSGGLMAARLKHAIGINDVMKNSLDRLVSDEFFSYAAVALNNTSPRAQHAQESLREVITTMFATIVKSVCMPIKLLGTHTDAEELVVDESLNA